MTEKEFSKMIEKAYLTGKEIDVLREDVGLPVKNPKETDTSFRKRLQLMAWSKIKKPHD